jgi:hypothetical protein
MPQVFTRNCIITHYNYKKATSYLFVIRIHNTYTKFIINSFIQCVTFCFHWPALLQCNDLYVGIYLWPCIVLYPLIVKQNFVVCHYVSLTNGSMPQVKKVAKHWYEARKHSQTQEVSKACDAIKLV